MNKAPILTIAVPTYNMEKYLAHNLDSIVAVSHGAREALEVLVLNNSSTDESGRIADEYAQKYPQLFTVIHKENNGYGSSVNLAIEKAKGRYLRIVDADDWVNPEALAELIVQLKNRTEDLLLMPYSTVDMRTGNEEMHNSAPEEWRVGETQLHFSEGTCPVPQMHGTVFRVEFLRQAEIRLLENAYYVDEQLMIWAYMSAESACKLENDVYRYRIGMASQSVSSNSMGRRWRDRERVIRSCLERQGSLEQRKMLKCPCPWRLSENIGNHFTTLYMYVKPRKEGYRIAGEWRKFVQENAPDMWEKVQKKAGVLSILCVAHISPSWYEKVKNCTALRKIIRAK